MSEMTLRETIIECVRIRQRAYGLDHGPERRALRAEAGRLLADAAAKANSQHARHDLLMSAVDEFWDACQPETALTLLLTADISHLRLAEYQDERDRIAALKCRLEPWIGVAPVDASGCPHCGAMREQLRAIGYPRRGTDEESATLQDFADAIQQRWSLDDLEAPK